LPLTGRFNLLRWHNQTGTAVLLLEERHHLSGQAFDGQREDDCVAGSAKLGQSLLHGDLPGVAE
jgi:hypothetical protein